MLSLSSNRPRLVLLSARFVAGSWRVLTRRSKYLLKSTACGFGRRHEFARIIGPVLLLLAASAFGQQPADTPKNTPPPSQAEQEKAEKEFELNKIMMEST